MRSYSVRRRQRLNVEAIKEKERLVRANDPSFNNTFFYAGNTISTSKYNVLTFLPLNMFEQFRRIANAYFLFLLILQLIPWISSLTYVTTVVPLLGVLTVTAVKDAYDDIQRHRSDSQVNNRTSLVLDNGTFVERPWHKVVVGDIIKMENDQFVAADLFLLTTSEPNSLCYIETAELDGETNLKVRQALPVTADLGDDIQRWTEFGADVQCEAPNNNLSKFDGRLLYNNETHALNNDQMLLRGCVLRNTKWCYGLVIFAGRDTKLMMNSGKTQFKRTHTDQLLNVLIIGIFMFLIGMCLLCVIACGAWETIVGYWFQDFLPWPSYIPATLLGTKSGTPAAGATSLSLLVFFSYIIVLNTVVPISLYVSVEVLRLCHSFWINWDVSMYYPRKDTPAKARTTTLNEELGQIEYIFSDKTGTLTQNIMTFNKCSINGIYYGDNRDENGHQTSASAKADFTFNPMSEETFEWYDAYLVAACKDENSEASQFFRLLAVCHTVMPEVKNGKLIYQAQSPDENALVSAARNFGFVFKSRTPTTVTIEVHGQPEVYELLCILDFNNVRKRMSVIVRKDKKILLLCKGADTTVCQRLHPQCRPLLDATTAHLNDFANIGLRTLCLAVKELDETTYAAWKEQHHQASVALQDREEALHNVYELIETNMMLIGATAIEDRLQDGVPEAIANLANAGIKIWVLTGDKQETAINIGYSCKLLTEAMEELFVVDGEDPATVEKQLKEAKARIAQIEQGMHEEPAHSTAPGSPGLQSKANSSMQLISMHRDAENDLNDVQEEEEEFGGYGIVINGHSLVYGLSEQLSLLLLEVSCLCKAVICCRVTPLQKAQVVDLVKTHKKTITLAIGDGANDVSMIKTAHIGVGISGQEGMQAVLASDYSFAQFRFLERLLLVHGRLSYLRMSKFLQYFFYKNFAFTLGHFWYAFFNGFSADAIYDPWFIAVYNVVYTSLPVLVMGIFERDIDDQLSLSFPKLYTPGHKDMLFNKKVFAVSLSEGILTSFIMFFLPYGSFRNSLTANGLSLSTSTTYCVVVAATLIITVTLRCAIDTWYWTPFNHVVVWGSIVVWFAVTLVMYSNAIKYSYVGSATFLMSTAPFWLVVLLGVVICLLPTLAYRLYRIDVAPTLAHRLRLRAARSRSSPKALHMRSRTSIRREKRAPSVRSGYAFAHEEGMGAIITSGRYLRKEDLAAAAVITRSGAMAATRALAATTILSAQSPTRAV